MVLTYCNLESNYVYYYQHSLRTDKKGLPFVALDQLWWYVHTEDEYTKRENYEYRVEGMAAIWYDRFKFSQSSYPSYVLLEYSDSLNGKEKYYHFDDNFKLVNMSYYLESELPFSKADEQYALQAARKVTQQIIDESTRPLINLQWLYDLLDWGNKNRDERSPVFW